MISECLSNLGQCQALVNMLIDVLHDSVIGEPAAAVTLYMLAECHQNSVQKLADTRSLLTRLVE